MVIKFKSILDSPCGIRYMFSKLELQSSFSRAMLMESEMSVSESEIQKNYDELSEFYKTFSLNVDHQDICNKIKIKLTHLKDIRSTLTRLTGEHSLDDIEFFEIKGLAIISEDIKELLNKTNTTFIQLPNLIEVIDILDPEKQRILSFYVYDAYNTELAGLRKIIRAGNEYSDEHSYRAATIESRIRAELAVKLKSFATSLEQTLFLLGKIDLLFAKILQIEQMGLTIPKIAKDGNKYEKLFNPEVKDILAAKGDVYQNIDIDFTPQMPLLITGANMGGKTITLKTLALAQYLFQFGFGVPAKEACIKPVFEIHFSIGDEQSLQKGLSSFAAQMLKINDILKAVKNGKFILSLIDEPANATNPLEGTALVASLLKILQQYSALTVATTHYNVQNVSCKKLRVKGFENSKMHYSLVEDNGANVPHEALRIATVLGIDNEWINAAEKELNK